MRIPGAYIVTGVRRRCQQRGSVKDNVYNRRQNLTRNPPCPLLPPASEVLLRHSDDFEPSRILFAGDLQDDLPARLDTAESRALDSTVSPVANLKWASSL